MFRPGADVEIKGGQAVLTPRGRAEFAVWRYTLSAVALGSFVSIIVLLFLAMRFPARLGNRVLDLVHTRVQADADAKIQVAGQRKQSSWRSPRRLTPRTIRRTESCSGSGTFSG